MYIRIHVNVSSVCLLIHSGFFLVVFLGGGVGLYLCLSHLSLNSFHLHVLMQSAPCSISVSVFFVLLSPARFFIYVHECDVQSNLLSFSFLFVSCLVFYIFLLCFVSVPCAVLSLLCDLYRLLKLVFCS